LKNKEVILFIVDDDPIFRFMCRHFVSDYVEENNILEFINGKEALENIHKKPTHIFLDINMPVLDGWQFLDEILKLNINHNIEISIVSSSIDPQDFEKFKKFKLLKSFLQKPLNPVEISKIFQN
jgi:CheY-like chemotaxis protein